jgi:hypothetical protein
MIPVDAVSIIAGDSLNQLWFYRGTSYCESTFLLYGDDYFTDNSIFRRTTWVLASVSPCPVLSGLAHGCARATWVLVNLTMWAGYSGPARSTVFLVRHEHGSAQSLLGRAGAKPALGHAWASPQARWARHGTTRNRQLDEAR